jgi:putative peptidoglycan lipid II flippase
MATESLIDKEPTVEAAVPHGIVGAATILSIGDIASGLLGLGRVQVIYYLFGASGYVSVFLAVSGLVFNLYDLLVGGLISAALVPIFSEYADRKEEYWRLVSVVLSVLGLVLALVIIVLEFFAEPLFSLLGAGYPPELRAVGVQMIRLILPAVFFLSVAGVLTGILLSLKKFMLPAFTTATFNLGIILCGLALTPIFGITSLVIGVVLGSAAQLVLQATGLLHSELRFSLDFSHPALRRIWKLYLPVLGGLTVASIGVVIDRNLASRTGEHSLAWMQAATYLVQLPIGLVAGAVSMAILPNLSRAEATNEFRSTLAFGLKLILMLILPCIAVLYVLAVPVVALLYEHGAFTANDTLQAAHALQLYLLGTAFAAIDQPLVFAFYARKNTLLPNLVAVVGLGAYLVTALFLIQPLGYLGLVLANSAQLTVHALVMLWLTQTRLGGLGGQGLVSGALQLALAAALMGAVMAGVPALGLSGVLEKFEAVILPALVGGVVYLLLLRMLRVREAAQIADLFRRRFKLGIGRA